MLAIILLATVTSSVNGLYAPLETSGSKFAEVLKSNHFLDKTDIVKAFFEASHLKLIVTAPRRFCKSTNLDVIRRFCEITVDANGNRVQRNLTENYKLFAANNLDIYKNSRAFFDNNFGLYPVIYLDLNRLNCSTFDSYLITLKGIVSGIFQNHGYLLNSARLDEPNKKKLRKYYNRTYIDNLDEIFLTYGLNFLSNLLVDHFNGQRCILLIDNYDWPVREAIFKSYIKDLKKIADHLREFTLLMTKGNKNVLRAMFTACVRLEPTWLDAFNVLHIPFTFVSSFATFFGFTEEEVRYLLDKHNLSDNFDNVTRWYGGYGLRRLQLGEDENIFYNVTIYNPFSVANYLANKSFHSYWVQSGIVDDLEFVLLHKRIRIRTTEMLRDNSYDFHTVKYKIDHVITLNSIMTKPPFWRLRIYKDENLFVQFMADTGYFNLAEKVIDTPSARAFIPNLEMRKELIRSKRYVDVLMPRAHY